MTRRLFKFLTPHKVLVLILVHAYCTSLVPPKYNAAVFKLLLDQIENPSSKGIRENLSHIPSLAPKTLYDVLLELIWSLDSFDRFHTFIMSTPDYITSRISSTSGFNVERPVLITSVLGRFLRRCRLEYVQLDFDAACQLWKLCTQLLAPDQNAPVEIRTLNHTELAETAQGTVVCYSYEDIEKLCQLEIERLDQYGSRIPQNRIREIVASATSKPVSLFKDAVRAGDYFSAVGYLHSYFDHTITLQFSASEIPNFYQFALLHLAILHEQFHNYPEASWSIREAINTARENKDNASLLFSLAWLHQFAKKAGVRDKLKIPMSREESLQYLRMKSMEASLPSLLGIVNLMEAQELIRSGGSLVSVFENIIRTSHVNVMYQLSSGFGVQMNFQAALWSRLGNHNLSSVYTKIFTRTYGDDSQAEDVVRASCMTALQCFKQGHTGECLAIFDGMETVSQDFHIQNMVKFYRTTVELRLAINRGQVAKASTKLEVLEALKFYDVDSSMHTLMAKVEVCVIRADYEQALASVTQRFRDLKEQDADVGELLYLMSLHGKILLRLGTPAKALSVLIRCVDLSEKYSARMVHLGAVSLLCKVMNELDQPHEAYRILIAIMPFVIEAKDVYLEADSYLTLAESLFAIVEGDLTDPNFLKARDFLVIAQKGFESIEDVEGELLCLGKLAPILNDLGDLGGRDVVAKRICHLKVDV